MDRLSSNFPVGNSFQATAFQGGRSVAQPGQQWSGVSSGSDQVTFSSPVDVTDRLNMALVEQYRQAGQAFATQKALDGEKVGPPTPGPSAPPQPTLTALSQFERQG